MSSAPDSSQRKDEETEAALNLYNDSHVIQDNVNIGECATTSDTKSLANSADENESKGDEPNAVRADLQNKRYEDETGTRKMFSKTALSIVRAQLAATDLVIIAYSGFALWNYHKLDVQIIVAWMVFGLANIIGILWVITRNLFPFRDANRDKKSEKEYKEFLHEIFLSLVRKS
ncbi:hypothetical protein [Bifidobacterium bombi]|uniref:Uncharacterized protein n=1 Tax=Bifidobacterium bombi DSM 19703 TaxID=1341695 RepID=A0A080N3G2_9BIFI|nr:hypothetical protein [Bifidobacterium bombi]KFF31687.1 hypothetical protein BBOMB_1074 [Bifidobacterium bombi DSM 19703]